LPKDVRALTYKARSVDLDTPILNAIIPSNERQVEKGVKMITSYGKKKVGILGFAFKAGTDDLRESPLVEVIERLIGKGYDLRLYDCNVSLAALTGANRYFILNHIPHISRLMVSSMEEVLGFAEVLVIGNGTEEFKNVPSQAKPGQIVIDFVRISSTSSQPGRYEGICW
jgi:GDP-mannose 6-dehydrogenase